MSLPRFYVPETASFFTGRVPLPPDAAHHAGRALRLATGEKVALFNGSTPCSWRGSIRFEGKNAWVQIEKEVPSENESPLHITLVQALVSPEKLDWIVEKAVELGVSEIVLTPAHRSVTRLQSERLRKRLEKCRETIRAACEQCGRNILPTIRAVSKLREVWQLQADVRCIMAPGSSTPAQLTPNTKSILFAIGPEGGFSPEEIQKAQDAGWTSALLGPRVLRTETAGLACIVWANTLAGDFPRSL